MNRLSFLGIPLVAFLVVPVALLAQAAKPVINGPIKHGASFIGSRVSLDDDFISGLAQGSIFVAFGLGLGPDELIQGAIPYPTQLPSEPGGTQVTFRSIESGHTLFRRTFRSDSLRCASRTAA